MQNEYGRSLIEVIGVLAITGIMGLGAFAVYNTVRNTQIRTVAAAQLDAVAKNTRILLSQRGTYEGVSVEYLIKAGALNNDEAPLGDTWSVTSNPPDGETFSINLRGLSEGECDYFATAVPSWANQIIVNGYSTEPESHCFKSRTNEISFIVQ